MDVNYDFFISYRRKASRQLAEHIDEVLRTKFGYQVFFDRGNLANSNNWRSEIDDSLPRSRVVIVLLGSGSFINASLHEHDEFLYELQRACKNNMKVIPVTHGNTVKEELKSLQELDENVSSWLKTPTFLEDVNFSDNGNFDSDKFANHIVERMRGKDFFPNNYFPRKYFVRVREGFRAEALEHLNDDGRLSTRDISDLQNRGDKIHLNEEVIDKIIYGVRSEEARRNSLPAATTVIEPPHLSAELIHDEQVPADVMNVSQLAGRITTELGTELCDLIRAAQGVNSRTGVLSGKMLNMELECLDLQGKENGQDGTVWHLTTTGNKHGVETITRGPGGVAVPQIRWRESILPILLKSLRKKAVEKNEGDSSKAVARPEKVVSSNNTGDTGLLEDDKIYGYERACNLLVKEAWEHLDYISAIDSRLPGTIKKHLKTAKPQSKVSAVLSWEDKFSPETIGDYNAKGALGYGMISVIASVSKLTCKKVLASLQAAHGRTMVKNVFADQWPT